MSAESKKKRGDSGKKNAETQPFRKGGRPCNYSITLGNPTSKYGAGSRLVQAMMLGVRLPGFSPSRALMERMERAVSRCTHPALTLEDYCEAAE